LIALLAWASSTFAGRAIAADIDSAFENNVRPLLAKHCLSCHSEAGKPKSGLVLSDREAVLRGGASGPALVPGKSAQSLLIQMIDRDGAPHMPPKGQLSDDEMAALAKWIDALPATTVTGASKEESKSHWAFRAPIRTTVPAVKNELWVRGPIDAFVLAKLEARGLTPAPPASKTALIRRAYFDLIGLPPSPDDVMAFLADASVDAYEKIIDRLLASSAYGERWGRHWLDLARFADSGGFHSDLARPNAWRYRDYVIKSFNADKPYPQFIREQLAGDEIAPNDADALAATGFGRNGPSNDDNMGKSANDLEKYRMDELDGVISTTFATFQGLTLGCARCHDHKYDPLTQKDYYRVIAIFNGVAKKELPLPGEQLVNGKLKDPQRGIMALIDNSSDVRPTRLLWRGDVHTPGPTVEPGIPAALESRPPSFPEPSPQAKSSGRRLVLADWIASPENALTYRVMVNRVWQHHFGRGLVETSGDFGRRGAVPSHPELLDHLALEFAKNGRLKPLHKAIMMSATFRQSSQFSPAAAALDPDNRLLWRQNKRRLEAEAVRDSILAVAGMLNPKMGGPGVKPRIRPDLLPASQRNKWPELAADGPDQWRRSVYIYAKRQLLFPLLDLFDAPNTTDVCNRRTESVVPTQALLLMNDDFVNDQAGRLAARVQKEAGVATDKQAERALWLALSRLPSGERVADAVAFLKKQAQAHEADGCAADRAAAEALTDLCHVLFNCNEFIFLD
jgi:cytochrome c553